ncbi:hypothetical protein [Streptomyces jeddahensis]|uniref:hypothetical protein n=1 Tax=Streptomyces jeddahensis TaxID=1716141 RepID=UPI0012FF7E65|nr:hypothetical protein [Streptomyces jeddahensis]
MAAIAAVLVLVGGGIWAGATLLNRPDDKTPKTGAVRPYGDEVGLTRDGDSCATMSKMVDVQSFALIPSEAGWDTSVRNTACIIFGNTVGLYGPVGDYRKSATHHTSCRAWAT